MIFIMTKIPTVENILVTEIKQYLKTIRFSEQYPHHKGITVSNDHPFEALLSGDSSGNLFPYVTIVSSNDGETPGMPKSWQAAELVKEDISAIDPYEWYMSESEKTDMLSYFDARDKLFGVQHSTSWRDSTSFEIWSENMQVKNDLYNLIIGYLTGPHVVGLHQTHGFVIHSDSIRGQRSGYYNMDFGRTLYGCKIDLQVDYPIVQAVYDGEISTFGELIHSYKEVIHG